MISQVVVAALAALASLRSSTAAPIAERANLAPVITTDFPDPSIIKVGDTWYAFASQSGYDYKNIKVQLATSQDFNTWTVTGNDALGSMGSWAAGPVWAPSVSQRADGTFLMYFSATTNTAGDGRFHCVGVATSSKIEGPYNANSDEPFACPTDQGGAIDASGFVDTDGTTYVVYKIDANSLGHGGSCGNSVDPVLSTPIMIQKTQADGTTKIGDPVELISNSQYDGPLVEAPYIVKSSEGVYFLFFSSNCYTTDLYDVSYATSTSPTGDFVKSSSPLFVTGTQGLIGPGGAQLTNDGHLALHGYASQSAVGGVRSLYVTTVTLQGTQVVSA